jgi:hypothetical protein
MGVLGCWCVWRGGQELGVEASCRNLTLSGNSPLRRDPIIDPNLLPVRHSYLAGGWTFVDDLAQADPFAVQTFFFGLRSFAVILARSSHGHNLREIGSAVLGASPDRHRSCRLTFQGWV